MKDMKADIVILGIGQSLRGDDRAGLEAVRRWQMKYPLTAGSQRIRVECVELPGLGLLELLKGAAAGINVDAVRSEGIPGSVYLLKDEELLSFGEGASSAHGWGIAETLALGRRIAPEDLPGHLRLIGIEAGGMEAFSQLSPGIEAALQKVAELIEAEVRVVGN